MMNKAFNLGHAVRDGIVRFVSVSQLESFDPTVYGGCNRRWWFRRVVRDKEEQRKPAELGEQLHSQTEHYLGNGDTDVLGDIVKAGFRFLPRPGSDLKLEWEFGDGDKDGPVTSPLVLAGVPLIGKVDCAHARGEWVNDDGDIIPEPGMVEVIDWKSTKRIDDVLDAHGDVKYAGLAKDANTLANTHQMRAYAALAVIEWPDAKFVRLSHGYFQTQWPRAASKRSKLVDAAGAMDRFLASEPLVEKMKAVARAEKVTDVEANTDACWAFGGVCSYRDKCPRPMSASFMTGLTQIRTKETGEKHVSLIKKRKEEAAAAAATTSITINQSIAGTDDPDRIAFATAKAVAAEIEKLKAEEAGIAPPDEPAPKDIAAIPEATTVPTGGETGGPCASGGQQIKVADDAKAYECACGATLRIRPKKLGDGGFYAMVPSHTIGEKPKAKAKKAEVGPAYQMVIPASAEDAVNMYKSDTALYTLVLDASVDGVALNRLETYADKLAAELAESQGAADIRCAPEKSALAFGKWKGALTAYVKENPPPPGYYAVSSTSELGMVAFDALLSSAGMVVRGSR